MTVVRRGNTRDFAGLPTISQTVVHDGVVHTCGVTGQPGGDAAAQTEQVLARIDTLLAEAGTDKHHLLTAQVWLADMDDFAAHNEAWNRWVDRERPPVRTCTQAGLWRPGLLVEIQVSAVLRPRTRPAPEGGR